MATISREEKLNLAFVRVADTLIADFDLVDLLSTLLAECVEILDVQAGGLMLADGSGDLQLMASTSEQADFVEVMQLNAGSGPCVLCFTTGAPVSVADIERSDDRWPAFQAASLRQGFRSVYAVPMRLRGRILGTMNLFGSEVGELGAKDAAVAQALADVATISILQERGIRETAVVADQLQRALGTRILIEQAKGVLSATNGLSMEDAFRTLREYARGNNLALRVVAEKVVDRTLNILESATEARIDTTTI
jgi:GAF domain-containing protein